MNERYYRIYLDKETTEFSIYENKFLSNGEYTSILDKKTLSAFFSIREESKQILNESCFFDGYVNYSGYKLGSYCIHVSNDYKTDGFVYDERKQLVIYGDVAIYATFEDGQYIDVVTGNVIPNNIIVDKDEVFDIDDLDEMLGNFEFVSKYVGLYSKILDEIINKLTMDYINREQARVEYDRLCLKEYEKQNISQISIREKVKKIILNMRK